MSEESLKSHEEKLTMNIKNRRILFPSYFAEPITVEEVISEGELYLLRVKTQRGNLEEITVESKTLEKALIESPKEFVKLAPPSDLVIIDEAHKCSARTYGKDVKKTHRYQLAERLSEATDKLLLLTATPHQGDVDQFAHFLRLIDSDQFIGGRLNKELLCLDGSPWFLRRMKEELRDFQGRKLFTERHAYTQEFELSPRVAGGEKSATLARDEALKRVDALKARLDKKLSELAHLRVVRPGSHYLFRHCLC